MTYLTLDRIKKHLVIDSFYTDDDDYLTSLADVVESVVEKHIDDSLESLCKGGELPPPLLQAMLLLIGSYYNTRESISTLTYKEVPQSYTYLLDLFKSYK